MLALVLAAAKRSGVTVSPMTVAFSLAAADAAHATTTVEEGANFVVQSWGSLPSAAVAAADAGARPVFRYTVRNKHGAEITVTNFGATLLSFRLHGRELTLNHSGPAISAVDHARLNQACYGTVCGRVANRISRGKFTLDGEDFQLAVNNGENHLHGGPTGFHRRVWDARLLLDEATGRCRGVELRRTSPDGEEGFPGTLKVRMQYILHDVDTNALELTYEATVEGRRTPINLTNHTYWNLGGLARTVHDHRLSLNCSHYLPVTSTQIPTGEVRPVKGTAFDFKSVARTLAVLDGVDGAGQPGFDHCLVVDRGGDAPGGEKNKTGGAETEKEAGEGARDGAAAAGAGAGAAGGAPALVHCAEVSCDGVVMRVATTQPGVQLYTANWLDGDGPHRQHMAFCLETQNFPDAINQRPDNGCPAVLAPGETYIHRTMHTFSADFVDEQTAKAQSPASL